MIRSYWKRPPFINSPVFTKLSIPPLHDFHHLLSKSKVQAMGTHNPAVLLLIFLSLHLMALSIMWTVWDYSTWYEKASGRTLQKQLCWNESLAYTPNHLPILSHFQFWPYYHILSLTFILLSFCVI